MASESETKAQFVRKATKFDILMLEFIVAPCAFVGGTVFALLIQLTFPTSNFGVFLILWLFFPILLTIVTLLRNRILERVFRRLSHDGIFHFAVFWKSYPFFVIAFSFLLGLGTLRDPIYVLSSFSFFSLSISPYLIFEHPLSYEGGVQILFEGLFSSIDDFSKRQYYWKKISKTIEDLLRIGNIQVSSNDLIFHFNKKLLETNEDISDDLRSIRAWMLGEQKTCLDSIKSIFPEVKIEPCTKVSFLRRALGNPTPTQASLIKFFASWIFAILILLILLISHPELLDDFLKSLLKWL